MCWFQWGEIRNLDPITQARFDEFWNNNVSPQHKPKMLCSDGCEMIHTPNVWFRVERKMCYYSLYWITNIMHWWFIWSYKLNQVLRNHSFKVLWPTWKCGHAYNFFIWSMGSFNYAKVVVKYVDEDDTSFSDPKVQI
jgi:hypothetical protein